MSGDRLPAGLGGAARTTTTTQLGPSYLDVTRLAVGRSRPRYRAPMLTAYTQELWALLGWCQAFDQDVLRVTRGRLQQRPGRSRVLWFPKKSRGCHFAPEMDVGGGHLRRMGPAPAYASPLATRAVRPPRPDGFRPGSAPRSLQPC